MSNEKCNYRHLDSLLSGLEDGILSFTDLEVETECSWYSGNAGERSKGNSRLPQISRFWVSVITGSWRQPDY